MGIEYSFACIDCNEIYDMDKWNNALRFLPYLQEQHQHHNYVSGPEWDIDKDYLPLDAGMDERAFNVTITAGFKDIGDPSSCNIICVLKNPKLIDCLDDEFLGKFTEWQEVQEQKRKRREERRANPKQIPEDWWKIEVEEDPDDAMDL